MPAKHGTGFSIKWKITSAFSFLLLASAATGGFALLQMRTMNDAALAIKDNAMPSMTQEIALGGLVQRFRTTEALYVTAETQDERDAIETQIKQIEDDYKSKRASFDDLIDPGDERKLFDKVDAALQAYQALHDSIVAATKKGDVKDATATFKGPEQEAFKTLTALYAEDLVFNEKTGTDAADDGQATFKATVLWVSIALTALVAACMLTGWVLIRSISSPISALTGAMRRLADKDLSTQIPGVARRDEIGLMAKAVGVFKTNMELAEKLATEATAAAADREAVRKRTEAERAEAAAAQADVVQVIAAGLEHLADGHLTFRIDQPFPGDYEKLRVDFNGALQTLESSVQTVSQKTDALRSGTAEISSASGDLSRRTEQQAASLEETAAALDEITATVKKTSEGSLQARKVVATAKADAELSGEIVGKAVTAMSAIEGSAQQVSQIIGVIDEIAFQTNLLALNAGVEAARAGEAGRGFAVVASEVRGLAQRSAEAAKEIKALISASGKQVAEGVELVGQTGQALKRIVSQIAEINSVVTEIASSTQEQATALQEVNASINQMDQVTQQNAAMVEQSTAASRSLAQDTDDLAGLIGQFKVGGQSSNRSRPVRIEKTAAKPKTVPMLRSTGRGGAAPKIDAAAHHEEWSEF